MKTERRKFDLKHLSERDKSLTYETIEKFDFDFDVEVEIDGHKIITSQRMARKLEKAAKA